MAEFIATYSGLFIGMLISALLALSLYLPLMTGQLSLASPGFYALGGYIAAILSTRYFKPAPGEIYPLSLVLLEIVIAAVASALLAIIIGIPSLRLRGIYLALATIAFVEVLRVLSLNLDFTGGAIGIFGIPQPFTSPLGYLWLVGPLLVLSMLFIYRLERTRTGEAFAAIREDELAASAMGINPTYYKVLAFTLGAILAGMVGVVSAHYLNTWNARQGTFDASVNILAYVIIGGSRTFLGPVVGGLLLTALPEILRGLAGISGDVTSGTSAFGTIRLIIFGILIALSTIFFPQGLITPEFFRHRKQRIIKSRMVEQ